MDVVLGEIFEEWTTLAIGSDGGAEDDGYDARCWSGI